MGGDHRHDRLRRRVTRAHRPDRRRRARDYWRDRHIPRRPTSSEQKQREPRRSRRPQSKAAHVVAPSSRSRSGHLESQLTEPKVQDWPPPKGRSVEYRPPRRPVGLPGKQVHQVGCRRAVLNWAGGKLVVGSAGFGGVGACAPPFRPRDWRPPTLGVRLGMAAGLLGGRQFSGPGDAWRSPQGRRPRAKTAPVPPPTTRTRRPLAREHGAACLSRTPGRDKKQGRPIRRKDSDTPCMRSRQPCRRGHVMRAVRAAANGVARRRSPQLPQVQELGASSIVSTREAANRSSPPKAFPACARHGANRRRARSCSGEELLHAPVSEAEERAPASAVRGRR